MAEVHFSICDSDETGSKNLNLAHIVVDGDESQPQAGAFPHASWSSETEGCCNHGSVSGQVMMRRNVLANTPVTIEGHIGSPQTRGGALIFRVSVTCYATASPTTPPTRVPTRSPATPTGTPMTASTDTITGFHCADTIPRDDDGRGGPNDTLPPGC